MGQPRTATTNYTGRTVDLLLLKTILEPGPETRVFPNVAGTPRMVTGIEKLVQRYAHIFLTNVGSVQNQPTLGTNILLDLGYGRIYSESTLRAAASSANASTERAIIAEDSTLDTPDDEALKSSEITGLSLDRTTATVTISVTITSKAGESFTYVMPLTSGV